jgi:hypothetical protein
MAYPLTQKQGMAWALLQDGLSPIQIAKRLRTSRQYVHQTLRTAEAKISKSLLEMGRLNGLEIRAVRPEKGILLGYHPLLKRNVVVTYTTRNGMRVWYWYDNPHEVRDEKLLREAREYLLSEAAERGLRLSPEQRALHPAKLAQVVFSALLPEVRP